MKSSTEKTNEVLERWGIDGEDEEMSREDIQRAAEMYAKISVRNRNLKRIALAGVSFVVVFLGLMLASVIIGSEVSKDFKVQNEALTQRSTTGYAVLQTGEMHYSTKLNLTTPLSVIKGIKSLKFKNQKDDSTIQFSVVSFYYISGRKLTLYGHSHMAEVLGNGNIEIYPISNVDGQKRVDESKMVRADDSSDLSVVSSQSTYGTGITAISDCTGLSNIGSTGTYSLLNNINCELSGPLLSSGFYGVFNGHGHTITLNMNVNGPAALFAKIGDGAIIANLFIDGNIVGKGNCSAFAIEAFKSCKFLACAVYANVTCGHVNQNAGDFTALGGFAAVIRNPPGTGTGRVSFYYSVNQGNFQITSPTGTKSSYTGGNYGRTGWAETVQTSFSFTYSASWLSKYGNSSHVNRFGFKYSFPTNTPAPTRDEKSSINKRDPYIPDDCYNYDDTNQDYINMCVEWYEIWWFENQDCCSDFNSCPYISCDPYAQACDYCKHTKDTQQQLKEGFERAPEGYKIIPTIKKLCPK